jgi:hypothetical protein
VRSASCGSHLRRAGHRSRLGTSGACLPRVAVHRRQRRRARSDGATAAVVGRSAQRGCAEQTMPETSTARWRRSRTRIGERSRRRASPSIRHDTYKIRAKGSTDGVAGRVRLRRRRDRTANCATGAPGAVRSTRIHRVVRIGTVLRRSTDEPAAETTTVAPERLDSTRPDSPMTEATVLVSSCVDVKTAGAA